MDKQELIEKLAEIYAENANAMPGVAVIYEPPCFTFRASETAEIFWPLVEALENMAMFDNPITRRQTNEIGLEALESCRNALSNLKGEG